MYYIDTSHFFLVIIATISAYLFALRYTHRRNLVLLLINVVWMHWLIQLPWLLILSIYIFYFFYYLLISNRYLSTKKKLLIGLVSAGIVWFSILLYAQKHSHLWQTRTELDEYLVLLAALPISIAFSKLVAVNIKLWQNKIVNLRLLAFLNHMTFVPTIAAGPITQYANYSDLDLQKNIRLVEYSKKNLLPGLLRTSIGIIKKILLCPIFFSKSFPFHNHTFQTRFDILISIYAFCIFFYTDISANGDLAVGISRLIQLETPEISDAPLLANNPQDYWHREYSTLGRWLNEYIFTPLYSSLFKSSGFEGRKASIIIAVFTTFLTSGIWHGLNGNFIRSALFDASVLVSYIFLTMKIKKISPGIYHKISKNIIIQTAGLIITFHIAAFSILLFTTQPSEIKKILLQILGGIA